ncbi:pullulanase-type alpha-1,6-glucosidase [Photobacterium profundum]|uniref:pullulanase-type alpha-1,6-glucosidase n=1 Tax=Photobacterium profundum TaxID=74109 RepID=UPI003D0F518E
MNFKLSTIAKLMFPLLSTAAIVGCNSSSDSSGDSGNGYFDTTNPPPIDINLPATDGPVAKLPAGGAVEEPIQAANGEAVLYFVEKSDSAVAKSTADYLNYSLHIWNNDKCDRADDELLVGWDDESNKPVGADQYGPYWKLPLTAGSTNCINLIVRDNNKQNLLGTDGSINFDDITDRTASIVAGSGTSVDSRESAFVSISGIANASAHLVDQNTLVWDGAEGADEVRLYVSLAADIEPKGDAYAYENDYIVLDSGTMSADAITKFPQLVGKPAFSVDSAINMRPVMKAEMAVIAVDKDGNVLGGTKVQPAGAYDDMFAQYARNAELGVVLAGSEATFQVWAPSAQNIVTVLYDANKKELGRLQMDFDEDSGVWSLKTDKAPSGTFYRYLVSVVHPVTGDVEEYEVTDPYSLSLSMNSEYSQVIDLDDPALKPDGWDSLERPFKQDNPSKFVIYESHVRDFSAQDTSTPEAVRGKFEAFTQDDTVPVRHLKSLQENGVTHLQLLPIFDIATINEDPNQVANINEPFSKLCDVNSDVKTSSFKNDCSSGLTIAEVLEREQGNDTAANPSVQELNRLVSATDSFNWGYDPLHYTVPEGSYSTNPDGTTRILEMREMVKSIKTDIGMNVVMDVVYNHTNSAGPESKTSVLDKIVPWYYNRLDPETGNVKNSTCCSNTAPERAMMGKLIKDSLVVWSRDYKIDSFRFDLMGHHPLAQIQESLAAVKNVDPNTYFYGEGWNFGEVENDRLFVQATQPNLGGTGIGSFSDRLRDAVRGGGPFDGGNGLRENQGFGNGAFVQPNDITTTDKETALHLADLTRLGMAGNLESFVMVDSTGSKVRGDQVDYNGQPAGYAVDPSEVQNYVSKHDNQTLWDNNQYKIPYGVTSATRVRMQTVSLSTAMLGQGVPFLHMGSELLRSKSMQRDSYDSGDWFNKVDFTLEDNNWNKGLPRKDKDGDNYDIITKVIEGSGENAKPTSQNMEDMVSFYQELANLRQSYPLITLGTGEEVNARVDFHNTGTTQEAGLIVMSIDNGTTSGTDLDSTLDALVIVINATPAVKTFDIKQTGFTVSEKHTTALTTGASVADTKLTVPAWTPVVFVQKRSGERGAGLPVSTK